MSNSAVLHCMSLDFAMLAKSVGAGRQVVSVGSRNKIDFEDALLPPTVNAMHMQANTLKDVVESAPVGSATTECLHQSFSKESMLQHQICKCRAPRLAGEYLKEVGPRALVR